LDELCNGEKTVSYLLSAKHVVDEQIENHLVDLKVWKEAIKLLKSKDQGMQNKNLLENFECRITAFEKLCLEKSCKKKFSQDGVIHEGEFIVQTPPNYRYGVMRDKNGDQKWFQF
jgi:hypothetical protein